MGVADADAHLQLLMHLTQLAPTEQHVAPGSMPQHQPGWESTVVWQAVAFLQQLGHASAAVSVGADILGLSPPRCDEQSTSR